MLTCFEPRIYQQTIFSTASRKNTLVVIPTGMGKTAVAFMLASHRLQQFPKSKILFLAPTKPLAEQHLQTFRQHICLEPEKMAVFTGEIPPAKRQKLWENTRIVFSTPQGLENDIINEKINLADVCLLIFDEAHRATGDYSYVFIAKQYMSKGKYPRILALTASPGGDIEKIEEVCANLFIEDVEIRTDKDSDVKPYIQQTDILHIPVELPANFRQIKQSLELCMRSKAAEIRSFGINAYMNSKTDLLKLQRQLNVQLGTGNRSFEILKTLSLLAEVMKVQHGLELLESQGISQLNSYLQKILEESVTTKVKAVKNLVKDTNFKTALAKTQSFAEQGIEHPKLAKCREIVQNEISRNKKAKILLFTQYRDSASEIKKELGKVKGAVSEIFVGQAKKANTGMSQKQQIELIQQFKDGLYNVLICTSVAEEGLDIPSVDMVLFYEPIPSAIRTIQRRGRTGRQEKGKVVVLMAKDTRDEGYRWSAHHKEKRMYRFLDELKTTLHRKLAKQTILASCQDSQTRIFADYREKGTGVIKELVSQGAKLKLDMLQTADYVLSARVGVEFKTAEDFVQSIIDGRLLEQLKNLKRNFERPIVIVEGAQDIFSVRNVHPNAIRGMLATITVSYGIPIIYTKDPKETAAMLMSIAKREQKLKKDEWTPHSEKKARSLKEQQEYVISGLPSVGLNLAKDLLKQFKTVQNILTASEDDLKKVDKVGDKIAKGIKDVGEKEYQE